MVKINRYGCDNTLRSCSGNQSYVHSRRGHEGPEEE